MFKKNLGLCSLILVLGLGGLFSTEAGTEELDHPQGEEEGTDYCDVKQYPESIETKLIQYISNALAAGSSSHEIIENVLKNYPSFREYFEKQREEGSSDDSIVGMFQIGFGLQFLAEGGCLSSQVFLGNIEDSTGKYQEALSWFRKAAEKGDASAQYSLGSMFYGGRGVPQDYREALRFFQLAAEQESAKAYLALGVMYSLGNGVPQDFVLAHMWANLVAANGNEEATELRNGLADLMTSEQIAEAQKLAREWLENHQDSN